jgi:predicted lipoprotein with Yx(FWY)xxD motif
VLLRSLSVRAVVVSAVLCLAAACGDDDDGGTATTDAQSTESSTTTTAEAGDGSAAIELTESDLGEILVSEGRTLYVFTPDDGGAPTCNDDCATLWPPLVADGAPTVGEGLDEGLFASATRDDGTEQVTVDGWPLYFFANDAAPGDTNGQGLGGMWYVVGPDGAAIEDG